MNKKLIFSNFIKLSLALFLCAVFAACAANTAQTSISNQMPQTSKPMPPVVTSNNEVNAGNLAWRLLNGKKQKIADFRGKVLILDFWATYCPPCEEEIPHLVELSNKHANDLKVVGLHVGGEDDKSKVAGFVTKYRMTYDLGYPEPALQQFYLQGDTAIPQTLVFDRNGNLIQKFVGFNNQIKADLDNAISAAIAAQRIVNRES